MIDRNPAFCVKLNGLSVPVVGWVVVDSLVDSMAMGGTRMTASVTEDEVRALARGMTLKLSLVGLPIGGAKAGIRAGALPRHQTLRQFGRTVAPLLHGGIHLGCDLGVNQADRAAFHYAANYDVRKHPRSAGMPIDWSTYWEPLVDVTGHGVGIATLTALEGKPGRAAVRVVVQGFGTVGRAVAKFLAHRGHRVVAVADVDGTISDPGGLPVDRLADLTDSSGTIDRSALPGTVTLSSGADAWLDVDGDVLVLAANMHAIHAGNVHRLRAGLVVEGGNLCCSPEAKRTLAERAVVVIPDVVANVGAAAAAGCALTGTIPFDLPQRQMAPWIFDWVEERVARNTRDLLELSTACVTDQVATILSNRRTANL